MTTHLATMAKVRKIGHVAKSTTSPRATARPVDMVPTYQDRASRTSSPSGIVPMAAST